MSQTNDFSRTIPIFFSTYLVIRLLNVDAGAPYLLVAIDYVVCRDRDLCLCLCLCRELLPLFAYSVPYLDPDRDPNHAWVNLFYLNPIHGLADQQPVPEEKYNFY